ncbi:RraA family protein [Megasphaera paucivorans]|uniref:Putative 4-hydroxy-4-methyl-2-oxoglutarate aldolase n=1 Tax=Megasphaera paucivorans TaxID=349095 RepID=A0A1G9YR62_9FIRM|nr:RraA family protein [Megasphaera paucivorans]SDN11095.1 RraA famliy [Megasphaera paucivorans]
MGNVGCKIIKDFKRPDRKVVELFKGMPVANIDDCMNRTAAVRSDIVPMNKTPLLGTAFTVKVPEGDNLMFHKAMDMAQPGDVIVIDAGGDVTRAIFGELMITYCHKRGLAGVILDGVIRDYDEIAAMDFPVYAKGAIPNGPYKNGPGEINTVISFGGKVICPGDIIIGDGDGIIVIKPEEAEELAAKTKQVMEKEAGIMDKIVNECSYVRPWVDEKLEEIGCEII